MSARGTKREGAPAAGSVSKAKAPARAGQEGRGAAVSAAEGRPEPRPLNAPDATGMLIRVPEAGEVSALLLSPARMSALYVLAHGAGAGMRHAFMEAIARRLAARGIGTLRYQFPYTEKGGRRPDPERVLLATVRAAVAAGREAAGDLPLMAGGKSMGGRMTSRAAAAAPLPGVAGLVFLGFPLHPAGQPGVSRADHLAKVDLPMLFLQGTRDALADLALLQTVIERLGARAALRVFEEADHSFHVPKKSGGNDDRVLDELAQAVDQWREKRT